MKTYNDKFKIEATEIAFQVLYNNEDCILYTTNIDKALKMARECAKCADSECSYQVYRCQMNGDSKIAEYKVVSK